MSDQQFDPNAGFDPNLSTSYLGYQERQYAPPTQSTDSSSRSSHEYQKASAYPMPPRAPNDVDASSANFPPAFDTYTLDAPFPFAAQRGPTLPTSQWHSQQLTTSTDVNGGDACDSGYQGSHAPLSYFGAPELENTSLPPQTSLFDMVLPEMDGHPPDLAAEGTQSNRNGESAIDSGCQPIAPVANTSFDSQPILELDFSGYRPEVNFSGVQSGGVSIVAQPFTNAQDGGIDAVITGLTTGHGQGSTMSEQTLPYLPPTYRSSEVANTTAEAGSFGFSFAPLAAVQDNWQTPQPAAARAFSKKISSHSPPIAAFSSASPIAECNAGAQLHQIPPQPALWSTASGTEQAALTRTPLTQEAPSTTITAPSATPVSSQASTPSLLMTSGRPQDKRPRDRSDDDTAPKRRRTERASSLAGTSGHTVTQTSFSQPTNTPYLEYWQPWEIIALYFIGRCDPSLSGATWFRTRSELYIYAQSTLSPDYLRSFWARFQQNWPHLANYVLAMLGFFEKKYPGKTITLMTQLDLWIRHAPFPTQYIHPALANGVPGARTHEFLLFQQGKGKAVDRSQGTPTVGSVSHTATPYPTQPVAGPSNAGLSTTTPMQHDTSPQPSLASAPLHVEDATTQKRVQVETKTSPPRKATATSSSTESVLESAESLSPSSIGPLPSTDEEVDWTAIFGFEED